MRIYRAVAIVCALLMAGLVAAPPATAQGVGSPAIATATTVGKVIDGGKWLVIGDSNSVLTTNQVQGRSYTVFAPAMTKGKLFKQFSTAVSGHRSDQQYLKLTEFLATGARPTMASVMVGTNDIAHGIPMATWQANYKKIIEQLITSGIEPVIMTLPPRSGPNRATLPAVVEDLWNAWLRSYAQEKGLVYVDVWKAVADPVTREFKTGYYNVKDGVHVNGFGQMAIAKEFVRVLTPHLKAVSASSKQALTPSRTDTRNLLPNGVFRSTSTAGWVRYGRANAEADSAAPGGYALNLKGSASDGLSMLGTNKLSAAGKFKPGDKMKIVLKSKIIDSGSNYSGSGLRLIVREWKGTQYVHTTTEYFGQSLENTAYLDHSWEWTVSPGTTAMTLFWKYEEGAGASRRIHAHLGGVGLYNLTALGRS
jgi:lysophospholipase L1-like esterase